MSLKNKKQSYLWLYWAFFFLMFSVVMALFGGLENLLKYKKSVQPDLVINISTTLDFTREFLYRVYQKITTKSLPEDSKITSFWLYSQEKKIHSLNSNLPVSAKEQYISGHVKMDHPGLASEVKFRYRGGLPIHWLYEKKSFRIKLPDFSSYRDEQKFDLVNFVTPEVIIDLLSYQMAKEVNLLSPDFFPGRVFVNNNYNGLHFFLSGIDESLLRKNQRMPGSIYSGDTLIRANPFGNLSDINEEFFFKFDKNKNIIPLLWTDSRLWKKLASRDFKSKDDRKDIETFINIINLTDQVEFMRKFQEYFDKKKFYSFWALDSLTGTYHHDMFHNHKLYFDPYKGKFEPIAWDLRFWLALPKKDTIEYPLLKQIKLNPVLEFERDKVAYEILQKFSVERVIQDIDNNYADILPEIEADPTRQVIKLSSTVTGDKAVPLDIDEFKQSIEALKLNYKKRYKFLQELYKSTQAYYTLTSKSDQSVNLKISVNGNNPIVLSMSQFISKEQLSKIKIFKSINGIETPVFTKNKFILYPGRRISKGNHFNRNDSNSIKHYGNEKIEYSPLHYEFVIKGINNEALSKLNSFYVKNALTNQRTEIKKVDELPDDTESASIHPWKLPRKGNIEQIILQGNIDILEDKIYTSNQHVRILPGTTFNLGKNASMIFYGQVIADGNFKQPIVFKQRKKGEPWGAIIIQGQHASASIFNFIQVSGGSISSQNLIHYPGQFNIHDVDSFEINNCHIMDNQIGDDAFHIAYSKGHINKCHFENSAYDALDIDISEVTISESEFNNIGNDAIDSMNSDIIINKIKVDRSGDKCISIGEKSDINITNSELLNCYIGIAVKDGSKLYVNNINIENYKKNAIVLYQKNTRYGSGGMIDGKNIYGISKDNIILGKKSINLIPDNSYFPKLEKNNIF